MPPRYKSHVAAQDLSVIQAVGLMLAAELGCLGVFERRTS